MDNWVIIKTGAKQYLTKVGDTLAVEKIEGGSDGKIKFDQVLAAKTDKGVAFGTPTIEKAFVSAKVVGDFKDQKIRVVKFKSKSKYTRTTGHRQSKTRVLIEKIQV